MKAVILDGSRNITNPTGKDILTRKLEENGWEVNFYQLCQEEIATCTGCFGCWLKTPGQCIINDKGREIAKKVIQSDLVILLSSITFGGYSYHLKKIVDRFIPNILPFFAMVNGEIHHQPRYDKNPNILAIGYLRDKDQKSEEIFKKLIKRNAINFHSPCYAAEIVVGDDQSMDMDKISNVLKAVEMVV